MMNRANRAFMTYNEVQFISSVVRDFQFFVTEKWEIASDRQGSSNTANYGKIIITTPEGQPKRITRLKEFLEYRGVDVRLVNPMSHKPTRKKRP